MKFISQSLFLAVYLWRSASGQSTEVNFAVSDGGIWTCTEPGSRCAFRRAEFAEIDFGSGQELDLEQNAVFASLNPSDDALTLGGCNLNGRCVVTCNEFCSCTLSDGSPCEQTTMFPTASPTDPPPTAAPVDVTCPYTTDTSLCRKLMPAVPIGTNCACYNFCRGNFTSCCEENSQCGSLECEAAEGADAGTMDSYVWGCTDAHRPTKEGGGSSASCATYLGGPILLLAYLAAIL